MTSRRTYISIFAAVAIAAPGIVAAINVAVDPWGYFGTKLVSGFNVLKPEMGLYEKELKAHRVASLRPTGLVLGASNSDVGLNPEHPGWSADTVYNLAAGQSSISLVRHYLLHAMSFQMPSQIVLGLDMAMFNPSGQQVGGLNPASLAVLENGARNREYFALNYYANAFSLDMLVSSFKVVAVNRKKSVVAEDHRPQVSATGMMNPENFPQNLWKVYRQRFQPTIGHHIKVFWAPLDKFRAIEDFSSNPAFAAFEDIVRLACDNNIELAIMISPEHAYLLAGQEAAGLTELWEQWLRAVVAAATEQTESNGCAAISVWDFSGYNEITSEIIATTNKAADAPKFYWDPIHYTKDVGDAMLNQVFNYADTAALPNFGVRLTPANIDERIAHNRAQAELYRQEHADEVALANETAAAALATTGE